MTEPPITWSGDSPTRIAPQRFKAQMVALILLTLALARRSPGPSGSSASCTASSRQVSTAPWSVPVGAVLFLGYRRIDNLIEARN